jgi:hypothetical protein
MRKLKFKRKINNLKITGNGGANTGYLDPLHYLLDEE